VFASREHDERPLFTSLHYGRGNASSNPTSCLREYGPSFASTAPTASYLGFLTPSQVCQLFRALHVSIANDKPCRETLTETASGCFCFCSAGGEAVAVPHGGCPPPSACRSGTPQGPSPAQAPPPPQAQLFRPATPLAPGVETQTKTGGSRLVKCSDRVAGQRAEVDFQRSPDNSPRSMGSSQRSTVWHR
jgi:hypothetical protein